MGKTTISTGAGFLNHQQYHGAYVVDQKKFHGFIASPLVRHPGSAKRDPGPSLEEHGSLVDVYEDRSWYREDPPFWWYLPGKMGFSWAMLVSGGVYMYRMCIYIYIYLIIYLFIYVFIYLFIIYLFIYTYIHGMTCFNRHPKWLRILFINPVDIGQLICTLRSSFGDDLKHNWLCHSYCSMLVVWGGISKCPRYH